MISMVLLCDNDGQVMIIWDYFNLRHATCAPRHLGNVPTLTSAKAAKCSKPHPLLLFHAIGYSSNSYLSSLRNNSLGSLPLRNIYIMDDGT